MHGFKVGDKVVVPCVVAEISGDHLVLESVDGAHTHGDIGRFGAHETQVRSAGSLDGIVKNEVDEEEDEDDVDDDGDEDDEDEEEPEATIPPRK